VVIRPGSISVVIKIEPDLNPPIYCAARPQMGILAPSPTLNRCPVCFHVVGVPRALIWERSRRKQWVDSD